MGFSGGGSNVLKPHKHSSAVQDGSPLNMNNVTEATLSAGDVIFSDGSALQRLAIGTPAQQIKVNAGATAPEYFTPAAAASTWTELLAEKDSVLSNTLDTGFITEWSTYRVLRVFWTAYASVGTSPFDLQFYAPDGNLITTALYGTSGFYSTGSSTLQTNANQTEVQLTFGDAIETTKSIACGMEIYCTADSTNAKCSLGSFWFTQGRKHPANNAVFGHGNFYFDQNDYFSELGIVCGIKEISGNTYTDSLLTVLGMGDNTS